MKIYIFQTTPPRVKAPKNIENLNVQKFAKNRFQELQKMENLRNKCSTSQKNMPPSFMIQTNRNVHQHTNIKTTHTHIHSHISISRLQFPKQ